MLLEVETRKLALGYVPCSERIPEQASNVAIRIPYTSQIKYGMWM
jgi:hypothetical protein